MNFEQMFQAFGKDSILLVKYHYMVQEKIDWSSYQGFIKEMDLRKDFGKLNNPKLHYFCETPVDIVLNPLFLPYPPVPYPMPIFLMEFHAMSVI